jgi:hypothetical protein
MFNAQDRDKLPMLIIKLLQAASSGRGLRRRAAANGDPD